VRLEESFSRNTETQIRGRRRAEAFTIWPRVDVVPISRAELYALDGRRLFWIIVAHKEKAVFLLVNHGRDRNSKRDVRDRPRFYLPGVLRNDRGDPVEVRFKIKP